MMPRQPVPCKRNDQVPIPGPSFSGEDGESDLMTSLATLGGKENDYSCHGQ